MADGKPDGLRIISKTGWSGKGVVFSRNDLLDVKSRDEFQQPGVYVLVGTSLDDQPMIYIGEGDPVKPRLETHYANKDFWTWCVFFCSSNNELNKAHIQYLESELIRIAKDAKRVQLDNNVKPTLPNLSEMEKAIGEGFLREIFDIYPLLGLTAFEKPDVKEADKEILYLKGKDAEAQGYESSKGFVVLSGSKARRGNPNSLTGTDIKRIEHFIKEKIFIEDGKSYVLTQDYTFTSPSQASGLFLARSSNGRIDWKNESGVTLKEIQENRVSG
ncbi:MAG: GIY-YIG nuclease family protein [Deferribacterales bacterium]